MASASKDTQELREAAAELERFAEYMNPTAKEPSTEPGSARTSQESLELLPEQNLVPARMEVDREKRQPEERSDEAAQKWPRSHAKGDRKGEAQEGSGTLPNQEASGKGRAQSPRGPSQRRSG